MSLTSIPTMCRNVYEFTVLYRSSLVLYRSSLNKEEKSNKGPYYMFQLEGTAVMKAYHFKFRMLKFEAKTDDLQADFCLGLLQFMFYNTIPLMINIIGIFS